MKVSLEAEADKTQCKMDGHHLHGGEDEDAPKRAPDTEDTNRQVRTRWDGPNPACVAPKSIEAPSRGGRVAPTQLPTAWAGPGHHGRTPFAQKKMPQEGSQHWKNQQATQNRAGRPKSSLDGSSKSTEAPSPGGRVAPTQLLCTGTAAGEGGGMLLAWQVVDVTPVHQQVAVLGVAEGWQVPR